MQPFTIHIPAARLITLEAYPLTRESVVDFVRHTIGGRAREVRIDVTVDHYDGEDIELATIELNSAPDGNWRLQYISHPVQSNGLTASIAPCTSDFVDFIQMRNILRFQYALTPVCAQELEDEGLGPLALLNLRLENPAPIVPSKRDLDLLIALSNCEPVHQG